MVRSGYPGQRLRESGQLDGAVHGLGSAAGEEHPAVRHRCQLHQSIGELVGGRVTEPVEAVVSLQRTDLYRDGLGNFGPAVSYVAVPQGRHGVDVAAAVDVPYQRPLAADHGRER